MSVTDVVEVTIPSFNIIIMERKLKQWWSTIHQYQQNEQPPLTSNHWKKKTHPNPGSGLEQAEKSGWV